MQKWEYGILDSHLTEGKLHPDKYWAPKRFKGKPLQDWQNLRFAEFIDELGRQGWELVTFSHSSPTDEYWVFKRQI